MTIGVELAARPELLLFLDEVRANSAAASWKGFTWLTSICSPHLDSTARVPSILYVFCASWPQQDKRSSGMLHQVARQKRTSTHIPPVPSTNPTPPCSISSIVCFCSRKEARPSTLERLAETHISFAHTLRAMVLIVRQMRTWPNGCWSALEPAGEYLSDLKRRLTSSLTVVKSTPRIGDRDWGELWAESAELEDTKAEILRIKSARLHAEDAVKISEQEYATPLWHQIKVVNRRQQLAFWRQPNYGFTRLFNHVVLALITGLAFLQLDDSRASLQYRIFVIFQVTVLPALILAQVEPKYDMARMVFYRESASKAYRQFPFALSMVLAELPYSIICAIGFFVPIYYLPGFSAASDRAGYQFLMILICELFSVTLGQTIAALTPSSYISALLNPPVMITFALFCGVAIPKPQIPGFWRAWLYQLDPFTRLIGGMVVTELHGLPVQCQPHELNYLTAPPGQTCGAYMANFFAAGGAGYISDANATGACGYCAYAVGDQFYTPLGLDYANRWRDLGIMAAFIGSNLGILFLGSRFLNFNRR